MSNYGRWVTASLPTPEQYTEALEIAAHEKCISVSMLQRRMCIGYLRATLIVERMDSDGLLGVQVAEFSTRRVFVPASAADGGNGK